MNQGTAAEIVDSQRGKVLLSVALSKGQRETLDELVGRSEFSTTSEYIRDLIGREAKKQRLPWPVVVRYL